MNEFTAKKLGEVLAFSIIGKESLEKGKEGFVKVFGDDLEELKQRYEGISEGIKEIVSDSEEKDITLNKAEKTSEKLRHMRDFYVGDEWDNSAELLEWSGFFEGAALVHWKLVEGAAESLESEGLKSLSEKGSEFHKEMLDKVSEKIKEIGIEKSS